SPSKSVQSNARAMRDVVPTTCLIHNGISVSRATPLLLRSRSTCFTPLLLSIPARRAYARPIAAMLATEAFSTPATALDSERTRATCTSSSKSCNKARRVWSTLHSFLPEPSGGSNHASIGRSLMPAQPLSPTMDSRLSVRPLAPTPKFPRSSISYTSNFTWKMRGSFSGQCADVVDVVSVEQPVHARGQVGAGEATNHAASNAVVVGRKRAELQRGMDAMEHQQEGLEPAISPPV